MDNIVAVRDVCNMLVKELSEKKDAYEKNGAKMTAGDLETIDKLSHALKANLTSIAMMEAEERNSRSSDREYSYRMGHSYMPYDGFSRHGGNMVDTLRDMMMNERDDSIRRDIQRLIDRMEMSR